MFEILKAYYDMVIWAEEKKAVAQRKKTINYIQLKTLLS